MIPYWAALFAYIPVAMLLMMDRNAARGFSLAYLIGLMFLPAGEAGVLNLPGVPDLSKENAPVIGILLGTILFRPEAFDKFKLTPFDLIFFAAMQASFMSAYVNDNGVRFAISEAFGLFLNRVLPIMLARIHLGTPGGLKTFLICLVLLGAAYVPGALWEFRMSPQIHTTTYGYFQHVFQQHIRGNFYRPILFFYHALALARFFAVCTFFALFIVRKDLVRLFGPYGNYVFLIPLFGLLLSQSVSPCIMLALISGLYLIMRRFPLAAYVLPTIGFVWMTFMFMGWELSYTAIGKFAGISTERIDSFQYRLDAIHEYKSIILNRFGLGHSGFGHGRIEGRATDSQLLIELLKGGILGTLAQYLWWIGSMYYALRVARRAPGTGLANMALAIAAYTSIALTFSVVDAGMEHFLLLSLAATYGIHNWLDTMPPVREVQRRVITAAQVARTADAH
ncbi:MAG: hypothetical protein GC168_06430 [Candidatus Hydrogenedens sp.]|nr:hypothetical protein [Candidatus Hydrogenedens sp.]